MFKKIFGFIKVLIEVLTVVGPVIEIPKLKKSIEVLTTSIESYSKQPGNLSEGKKIKQVVEASAKAAGVENYLHKKIKGFAKRQWSKLF